MSEKNYNGFIPQPEGGKLDSAEILLDAIGGIDDRFIAEAENAAPVRKASVLPRRALILAATIAISACMILSAAAAVRFVGEVLGDRKDEKPPTDVGNNVPIEYPSIEAQMLSLRERTENKKTSIENIDFNDQYAKIVWKYADEDEYRVCNIKSRDADNIAKRMQGRKGFTEVENNDTEDTGELEGIWINFGDGYVYSPCLEESNGNIGYGELFNYDPELEPTQDFINLVRDAINNVT